MIDCTGPINSVCVTRGWGVIHDPRICEWCRTGSISRSGDIVITHRRCIHMMDTGDPVPDRPCKGNYIVCGNSACSAFGVERIHSTCDCKPPRCRYYDSGLPLVLFLRREKRPDYRPAFERELREILGEAYEVRIVESSMSLDSVQTAVSRLPKPPAAILRFDEHHALFVSREWRRVCRWAHDAKIPLLSLDFGYFDHYQTRHLDRYGPDGESRIGDEWDSCPITQDFSERTEMAIRELEEIKASALRIGPPDGIRRPYAVLWLSLHAALARKPFRQKKTVWAHTACAHIRAAGLEPVIKASEGSGFSFPDDVTVIYGRDALVNARLALYAENNILVNSTVSNELTAWGCPVTALGKSWFSGLGVFHEPDRWEDIARPQPIDRAARERWISWWSRAQFYPDEFIVRFRNLVGEPK